MLSLHSLSSEALSVLHGVALFIGLAFVSHVELIFFMCL